MIHHTMREDCYGVEAIAQALAVANMGTQLKAFAKIEIFVMITILVLLLQLGYLMKPFAYGFFRFFSWFSYLVVPALITYILGLMEQPQAGYGILMDFADLNTQIRYLTCVWATFLLFAYAGLDNLNAFNIEERNGRSKLVLQLVIQFVLLLFILFQLPSNPKVVPIALVLLVLFFKFVERVVALAHSDGATPGIKTGVARIVDYMHQSDEKPDATTMAGFKYLVGPRYLKVKDREIVDGITLEKLWDCKEGLLSNKHPERPELKDNCLSFALFWLLLGKYWGYPLYEEGMSRSRVNAQNLIRHGLLANKDGHKRVFKVIEVELAFLRDYFHAKYIFFYLNGFHWKLIGVIASPIMFWWFSQISINYDSLNDFDIKDYGGPSYTAIVNTIVLSVILGLEALQLVMFLTSRWFEVTLVCYYVERKNSKSIKLGFPCWFLEKIGSILLSSSCNKANTWWRKPWKRELEQYSLIESCTKLPIVPSFLKSHLVSVLGVNLPKAGRRVDPEIGLTDQIREAVITSLTRNHFKLSNGSKTVLRHKRTVDLCWVGKHKKLIEIILIWHIATCFCELDQRKKEAQPTSEKVEVATSLSKSENFEVATSLSKYCSYLLFFASSFLPVPALEAESICNNVIEEARQLFKNSSCSCACACACGETKQTKLDFKYGEMIKLISGKEVENQKTSVLRSGVTLGNYLVTSLKDEEKMWEILSEFWAEMILFLAPSNGNETAHAEKLSEGGEFITHLWTLLIHAGITDRDDMTIF